jgi:hypothetical protein
MLLFGPAVIRRSGDSQAPEFVGIIFPVQDVPLFAAFQNFFLLRSNLLADLRVGLLFVAQSVRQNLYYLLANGVAILHKLNVVAGHQHFRNLVGQPNNLLAGKSHSGGSLGASVLQKIVERWPI